MSYLDTAARIALGAVFLAAAVGKVRPAAFRAFVASLGPVRGLPRRFARPAAAVVIGVEALAVAALAAPVTAVAGYLLAAAALAVFSAVAMAAARRGERLRCRCFGADTGPIGRTQLGRNALLAAVALAGLAARVATRTPPVPDPAGLVFAVAAGLAVAGIAVRLDDLVYLLAPHTHRRIT